MNPPVLEYAFEVVARIDTTLHIGHGGGDPVSFTPISGGSVRGPLLTGEVLAGGGDWSTRRGGRVTELDARYLVRATDGAVIDIVNRGFWVADPEVEQALDAGRPVPAEHYYFRTQPVFRTDAPAHLWLTHTVFVGVADDPADGTIRIRLWAVR